MSIHIDYAAAGPVEGVRFEVQMTREDGVLAFQAGIEAADLEGAILSPSGEVVFSVESLPLLEGLFRVGVTARDARTSEVYAEIDESIPFRVRSNHRSERGMSLVGHSWQLPVQSRRGEGAAAGERP
jgi:hypothetical protein